MTKVFTKVENIVEIDNPSEWKDIRIKEINAMGLKCDDSHPCFEEVMEIYDSNATTYEEFLEDFNS